MTKCVSEERIYYEERGGAVQILGVHMVTFSPCSFYEQGEINPWGSQTSNDLNLMPSKDLI